MICLNVMKSGENCRKAKTFFLDSLDDQFYDILKRNSIKPWSILEIALGAKTDHTDNYHRANRCIGYCDTCTKREAFFKCSICALSICNNCQKEHTSSHISMDVSGNTNAFFLVYLPAAYLCTMKYHTEVTNFDIISFS